MESFGGVIKVLVYVLIIGGWIVMKIFSSSAKKKQEPRQPQPAEPPQHAPDYNLEQYGGRLQEYLKILKQTGGEMQNSHDGTYNDSTYDGTYTEPYMEPDNPSNYNYGEQQYEGEYVDTGVIVRPPRRAVRTQNVVVKKEGWEAPGDAQKAMRLPRPPYSLTNRELTYRNFADMDLSYADMRDSNMSNSTLTGAYMFKANMRGITLEKAIMRRANLQEADLTGAYLGGADLRAADLRGANLMGADFDGANLDGAVWKAHGCRAARCRKSWPGKPPSPLRK